MKKMVPGRSPEEEKGFSKFSAIISQSLFGALVQKNTIINNVL